MREIISLNENWTLSFPKGDHVTEQVNLPHTWNAVDGNDGNGSYLRTTGVYTRTFEQPKQPREGGRTYVEVLAAALNATVKVNGTVATPMRAASPSSVPMSPICATRVRTS